MKKNHEVTIRYSKEELERVKRKAEELGMPVSSFIRVISLLANIQPTNNLQK
jgi:predicted DNA binding CopG/RHH family protein